MAKYACVRTDNLTGTLLGQDLVSLRYSDADIENGCILAIGGYEDGQREVRVASIPATDASLADIAIIASPEVVKDKDYWALEEFVNEAGVAMRGYRPHHRGIYSVTKEAFANGEDVTPEVGYTVELSGDVKPNCVETATGSTVIGEVIKVETDGARTWYVIEIA